MESYESLPGVRRVTLPVHLRLEEQQSAVEGPCAQKMATPQVGLNMDNEAKPITEMTSRDHAALQLAQEKQHQNYFWSGFWSGGARRHYQEAPKKARAVVTLQDIEKSVPTLRLKLENKAKDKKPCEPGFIREARECVEGMFQKAEADLDLEEEPAKEALERNQKRLDAIFDGIEQRIRKLRMQVKNEFRTLTQQQQKEVLEFWEAAEEFLGMVLDWLCQVFYEVLAKIRQGFKIEKDAIRGVFKVAAEMLKIIF